MYNISSQEDKMITKEIILNEIDEYNIYAFYLNKSFKVGTIFSSPFRKDKHPSFGIFRANNGTLLFKDLGTGESGDCFKFVKLLKNKKTIKQTLTDIYIDIILTNSNPNLVLKENTIKYDIGIQKGKFADYDLKYWEQFNITEDILKKFNVSKAYKIYNNDDIIRYHRKDNPIYAYQINNNYKIYMPLAEKKYKWISNTTIDDIAGYDQLPESGDILIISKAVKDVMFWYSIGYSAICPSSEGAMISEYYINILKKRFKTIIIWYDNDEPGINFAKKMQDKYGFDYKIIPLTYKEKDLTDFCAEHGIETTKKLIDTILNEEKKTVN